MMKMILLKIKVHDILSWQLEQPHYQIFIQFDFIIIIYCSELLMQFSLLGC